MSAFAMFVDTLRLASDVGDRSGRVYCDWEVVSATGEVITDSWITSRVHSKFIGEDLLKDSHINVDTQDHIVTLRGTVMSAAAKARAVTEAKEVEGVRSVVDHLTIGPKK